MQQSKIPPISAIDFRADDYSADGKNIIISLATKYAAERRSYSVPVECLYDFIADLQKLKSSRDTPVSHDAAATDASNTASTEASNHAVIAPTSGKDLNRVNVIVPKRWMLRSGLPDRPLVIMVFDPQTETQAGYALTETAAREMAVGLIKYADTLANYQANKDKPN